MILIAAMTPNRVIGYKKSNSIPWHNPQDRKRYKKDLQLFRELTTGDYAKDGMNSIVIGRRTYESIGRPLPNRYNVVISSSMPKTEGIQVCRSIDDAISVAQAQSPETFITGGATLYEQTIDQADTMYLSVLKQEYSGDVLFPEFSEDDWTIKELKDWGAFEWMHFTRSVNRLK